MSPFGEAARTSQASDDILRERNPTVAEGFRDERTRRPSVQLAFDEMRIELTTIGETCSFWLDNTNH